MVYLIGAGPGDPELITVRGMRYLESADVVLHDHLVHARLLRHARLDAEMIDVGSAAPQRLEQEAICYLLAEKAREGKSIVRLKWGDPFFFDSGGAEALFLHEQGVPYVVVPGVPADIAAPCYAGIPVTYPGGGDTLSFVRGHDENGQAKPSIDWTALGHSKGTVVCHAGPERLPEIVHALLSHGRPPTDPAALVYAGTLPTQETVTGTLEEIGRRASAPGNRRSAVLVVGRVAGLREHLRWFDSRPLFGKRVLVTRPRDEAAELVSRLEAAGAEAVEAPMIRILPPEDWGPVDAVCLHVAAFDAIVFASPRAVDAFIPRLLASPLDLRALNGVTLCAVGSVTAERLLRYGLKVDVTPSEFRAEALVRAVSNAGDVTGRRFLLPRADIGREIIADELRHLGADVTDVVAYRTVAAESGREGEPDVFRMLLNRQIDVVTFTSASAVRNFVEVIGADPAADLLSTTLVAAIGPVTAEAAGRLGIQTTIVPAQYDVAGLVDAIVKHFEPLPQQSEAR
jgi:uroporphyrinogen III methyltransferase / synthase